MQGRSEQEQALVNFREDVLNALANLRVEVLALQRDVERLGLGSDAIRKLRDEARTSRGKFLDCYAQTIRSAHEIRE